jgi:hypothetical protein
MSKSTEELMFGAESQAAVAKAVRDAVKRADAAGLVPAFQPYVALSKHLPKEELLALRRAERKKEAEKDRKTLEFHQKALELMFASGHIDPSMKLQAVERLQLFTDRQLGHPSYVALWQELLEMHPDYMKACVLAETEHGHRLRKDTPLDFLRYAGGPLAE